MINSLIKKPRNKARPWFLLFNLPDYEKTFVVLNHYPPIFHMNRTKV